jgi:Subtilase family
MWCRTDSAKADGWFKDLRDHVHERILKGRRPDSLVRVKVAVIDTGVNFQHPEIEDALATEVIDEKHCRGFPTDLDPKADKNGHGTFVVDVLLQTAPDISVYIARAFDDKGELDPTDDYMETANVRFFRPKYSKSYRQSVGPSTKK